MEHTILNFDIVLLANFLYAPQINLSYMCEEIINQDTHPKDTNLKYQVCENVAILDTYQAPDAGKSEKVNLFIFKID